MKPLLTLLSLLLCVGVMQSCSSDVQEQNRYNDSIEYYHDLSRQCDDLETSAILAENYTHAEIHKAKGTFYAEKEHQFKDSLFHYRETHNYHW